jgi:hypothetical protein
MVKKQTGENNNININKGTKLVFSPKLTLKGVSHPVLDLHYLLCALIAAGE